MYCFTEAVRRHRWYSAVGDDDIREACAKFFTGARDRRDNTHASARQDRLQRVAPHRHPLCDSDTE